MSASHSSQKSIHLNMDPQVRFPEKLYQEWYAQSLASPEKFWDEQARNLITWDQEWETVCEGNFTTNEVQWFVKGQLNACYNCVDRHLDIRGQKIALIWEGSKPEEKKTYTYTELQQEIAQFANVLKAHGVKKGDRVGIYLPMIPQLPIAMLACARIGAIHSVVFSGFSSAALKVRLQDTQAEILITADEGLRGEKTFPLKENADAALLDCPQVKTVIVVQRTRAEIPWINHRDHWYHESLQKVEKESACVPMDANDPLFILYTSGSTGKPKGVVHSTGGYLVYATLTHQVIFDHREEDIFFCTADPGWITGHTYLVYGPLANGATILLYEGVPNYPNFSRYWEIINRYQVTVFYTSPTALRALRAEGDEWVTKTNRQSLRLLGSVGEPIGAEIWLWFYHIVGEARCPIVNTWWQTETGGILISTIPGQTEILPGSTGLPFFGIEAAIVDNKGQEIQGETTGKLVIKHPWPGLMQTLFGDRQRFLESYFKPFPGVYLTGDGAHCNALGHWIITGRDDDVIKVSGHRFGTEELESALVECKGVSEVAVIGIPHPVKGECIIAFVTVLATEQPNAALKKVLIQHIRDTIGAIATPEHIYWAKGLPKTRSGKIMRRILRKIAMHEFDDIGDTSTLVDPKVVEDLIAQFSSV